MIHGKQVCLVGKTIGRLHVLEESEERPLSKNGNKRSGKTYVCRCECGVTEIVYKADLLSGKLSCGCLGAGGHNLRDLAGKTFDKLIVVKKVPVPKKYKHKNTAAYWECTCTCGNTTIVNGNSLYYNKTKSCGCLSKLSDKNNLVGKKFYKLLVKSRCKENTKRGLARWDCVCDCGNSTVATGVNLRSGRKKSCGCVSKTKGKLSSSWKGYGDIHRTYWTRVKKGAESRSFEFNITIEYAWELYKSQEGKCNLTGLLLKQGSGDKGTTASLDRIDSSKGYIEGNVQWLHKYVNKMKLDFDQKYFIDICKRVYKNEKIKRIK